MLWLIKSQYESSPAQPVCVTICFQYHLQVSIVSADCNMAGIICLIMHVTKT